MIEQLRNQGLTEDQIHAITDTGANLIVAAAAGAGKTTVLVRRFIFLVTAAEPPTNVDAILAVTFTEAAASQLKARIGDALRENLRKKHSARLARQILLLDKAAISTIHSFCLEIVRQNFHRLGLDPAFTVLDESEAIALGNDVMGDLFESLYEEDDSGSFLDLVSRYGGLRMDETLKEIVLKVHEFLHTIPNREEWMSDRCGPEDEPGLRPGEVSAWRTGFSAFLRGRCLDLLLGLGLAKGTLPAEDSAGTLRAYVEKMEEAAHGWIQLLNEEDVDSALGALGGFERGRRPNPPKGAAGWTESWKKAASAAQKILDDMKSNFGGRSWSGYEGEIGEVAPFARAVLGLARSFEKRYSEAKASQAILDFNDLERRCLELLWDEDHSGPSEIALALRDRFRHVLVDEYQDTNSVQDKILELVSRQEDGAEEPNFFAVGDVKQSIYRFRQAEPEVFLRRYERSSTDPQDANRRIDLSVNFRSRRGIIDGVNAIFDRLMIGGDSEITYNEDARLEYGAAYSDDVPGGPTTEDPLPVEFHLLPRKVEFEETDDDSIESMEDWEAADREAAFVANRIRQLLDEGMQVWDAGLKAYRNLTFRDIVILLRAPRGKAGNYSDMLHAAGIPVFAEPATGYFTSTEILDCLSLLRVVDNPMQDVPLAAVLRSPVVGLSEEDLVEIRLADRRVDYYHALLIYSQTGEDESLRKKTSDFLACLDRWRTLARRGPLADLVWTLYAETDYPAYVMGLENGPQRHANLIDLHDRARQFDHFKNQGLRRFLAFIDRLLESEGDIGQAPALSEAEDVVRIMSIHKSKGLEFPVVFLPDLAKGFNESDLRRDILFDRELGVACSVVDPVRRVRYPSLPKRIIQERIRCRDLAEELRVLYVAMTRAREHLVMSATVDLEKDLQRWEMLVDADPFKRARSMVDWLGPVLTGTPEGRAAFGKGPSEGERGRFSIHLHGAEEICGWPVRSTRGAKGARVLEEIARAESLGTESRTAADTEVLDRLNWKYPAAAATMIRGKESVTELKRRLNSWDEDVAGVPHWARALERCPEFEAAEPCGLDARKIGLAAHSAMEHLDLGGDLTEDGIRLQIQGMVGALVMTAEEREAVPVEWITGWVEAGLGRRMLENRNTIQREIPFTLRVPTDGLQASGEIPDEFVVVQGIIDAMFLEDGEYVILDYKTDGVTLEQAPDRAKEYEVQMKLYAHAVRSILNKPVKAAYLYFLQPGVAVEIDVRG